MGHIRTQIEHIWYPCGSLAELASMSLAQTGSISAAVRRCIAGTTGTATCLPVPFSPSSLAYQKDEPLYAQRRKAPAQQELIKSHVSQKPAFSTQLLLQYHFGLASAMWRLNYSPNYANSHDSTHRGQLPSAPAPRRRQTTVNFPTGSSTIPVFSLLLPCLPVEHEQSSTP